MFKYFTKYTSVGIVNTLIHWAVFGTILYGFHANQALSNYIAFCCAATFSFFANARFTFKARTTTLRYMLYIGFMGALSAATGWAADQCGFPPIFTLIVFSTISLICGFFIANSSFFGKKYENITNSSCVK